MENKITWSEIETLTREDREITIEFGQKEVDVSIRNMTVKEQDEMLRGLVEDMPNIDPTSREFLHEYSKRNVMGRVISIAGHEMEKDDWDELDSDLMDTLMWTISPLQMTLMSAGDGLVKKLQEG